MIEFKSRDVELNTKSMQDLTAFFMSHVEQEVNKRSVTTTVKVDGEKFEVTGIARKGETYLEFYFTSVDRKKEPKSAFEHYQYIHVRDLHHGFAIHASTAFLKMFNNGEYSLS